MIGAVGFEGEASFFSSDRVVAGKAELAIFDRPMLAGGGVHLGEAAQRQALVAVALGALGLDEGVIGREGARAEGGRRLVVVARAL